MNKRVFTWLGVSVGAATIAVALIDPVRRLIREDPFAPFREQNLRQNADETAITMKDTVLRGYQKGKLVMTARAKEVLVTRDRNVTTAKKLTDGVFQENDKVTWRFEADRGTWQDQTKYLTLEGNIRAQNKDMDLRLARLEYSNLSQDLTVPVPVQGKLFNGQLSAQDLKLNFRTNAWSANKVSWLGMLPQSEENPAPTGGTVWNITADNMSSDGSKETWLQATATSRNKETQVRADKIERFLARDGNPEILVATGNVRYFGVDANMVCERATIFRVERRAIFEGRVTMLIKPETDTEMRPEPLQPMRPVVPEEIATVRPQGPPSSNPADPNEVRRTDNRRRYPVRILAQRIEYWYRRGQRRAVVSGNPQARQDLPEGRWRMLWAPSAEWNGETDELTMRGAAKQQQVRMKASNGDSAKAEWLRVSTKEGVDEFAAGRISAEGQADEDELPPGVGDGPGANPGTNPAPLDGPIAGWRRWDWA